MIYRQLFDRAAPGRAVSAGVIGAGDFSTAIIAQSVSMPRLSVTVAADIEPGRAERAYLSAGVPADRIASCDTRDAAIRALERGQSVILTDPLLMMDLPVDVVVEATGDAEAGALHAREAIRHGKHVAMVNKETDVIVGPILKHAADQAGVVYTAVDGDQHGLVMGLVSWAREVGLEVLCAGKTTDADVVFRPEAGTLARDGEEVALGAEDRRAFAGLGPGALQRRSAVLGGRARIGIHDYEETVIMANATGLAPDVAELHRPVARTSEIPGVLCPVEDGGVLGRRGAVDVVIEVRDAGAAPMAGGVFAVVACANGHSRRFLAGKGHASNASGTASLIHRPYHLCGIEATMSILCAAILDLPTGATDYRPLFDVVARTSRGMAAGEAPGEGDVEALMLPAGAVSAGAPLPLRMALGRPLARDVMPGALLTADDVRAPEGSVLWSLRAEQDEILLPASDSCR